MKALKLLVEKYSPDHIEKGNKYSQNSFQITQVNKLEINTWSGKSKK